MGCPCEKVLKWLAEKGAAQAAKMHFAKGIRWGVRDWQLHLDEEDNLLRPYIVKHLPMFLGVYDNDHRLIRVNLAAGILPDEKFIDGHSAFEDMIVLILVDMGV